MLTVRVKPKINYTKSLSPKYESDITTLNNKSIVLRMNDGDKIYSFNPKPNPS